MLCLWSSGAMTHLDLNVFGIKLHLAWSISAAIIGICALHSAPPYTIHPWEQRTPLWQWPLGYPVRGEGGKEKTDRFSCMGIRCLHHHLSNLFQTWSMSIGFKMEPLRGNCKVMWFSININAWGYATGAL